MTGAILVVVLAALCAVLVFVAVLAANRPEGGWIGWLRESVRAWRNDELEWTDDVDEEDAGGLGTLYLMSEPGPAYTTAEELGTTKLAARLRDLRERAPELPDAGERSEARA